MIWIIIALDVYTFFLYFYSHSLGNVSNSVTNVICPSVWVTNRAQRDSIRSQTFHSKGAAYDITKYQTFLTKYKILCPFLRTFVNSRGTAFHIL